MLLVSSSGSSSGPHGNPEETLRTLFKGGKEGRTLSSTIRAGSRVSSPGRPDDP